jgi:hypothetical protein
MWRRHHALEVALVRKSVHRRAELLADLFRQDCITIIEMQGDGDRIAARTPVDDRRNIVRDHLATQYRYSVS